MGISTALSSFGGLHRRLERLPDWQGVIRYDDYAHHPTAVRAVLRALKSAWPNCRLTCIFQPHQLSRTEALRSEFVAALAEADRVIVTPVYAARESESLQHVQSSSQLVSEITGTCEKQFASSLDHVLMTLETAMRPGEVLVTLGAGDIDRLHHEIARRFS
jgi:UDP-N-acetylmuramate--alanine ligase